MQYSTEQNNTQKRKKERKEENSDADENEKLTSSLADFKCNSQQKKVSQEKRKRTVI